MIDYVNISKHPAVYRWVNILLYVTLLFMVFILFDSFRNLAIITDIFPE